MEQTIAVEVARLEAQAARVDEHMARLALEVASIRRRIAELLAGGMTDERTHEANQGA